MRALLAAALLALALSSSTDARADERLLHVDHPENITVRSDADMPPEWHWFRSRCETEPDVEHFEFQGNGQWWICGPIVGHVTFNLDGTVTP